MPKILERLVSQLKAKGMVEDKAYPVAIRALQKSGNMKAGSTELTAKGRRRQEMGAAGRAKERASRGTGHKSSEYAYNPRTNRATLRDKG